MLFAIIGPLPASDFLFFHLSPPTDCNFAMQLDEDKAIYEQRRRVSSFAPSESAVSASRNALAFGGEEAGVRGFPSNEMTPSSLGRSGTTVPLRPQTPQEVKLHFQLDTAQCSPIPGIPEEDGDGSRSSGAFSSRNRSGQNHSHDLSSASDKSSKKSTRPMPDMNAFEGEASGSLSHDRSLDDSKSPGSQRAPPSPKLMCPPTPVRTPAWAHNESAGHPMFKGGAPRGYGRSNSLIATKVLATCSPKMLDERASLENSSLEEGNSTESQNIRSTCEGRKSGDGGESDVDAFVEEADVLMEHNDDGSGNWLHSARSSDASAAAGKPQNLDHSGEPESSACPCDRPLRAVVSMATHFDVLSPLGRGTFADVYRVRSKVDGRLYAVKRNRRQFRGTRDREKALAEVKCMQRLQTGISTSNLNSVHTTYSLYLLFFFQAWQEDGHFFSQTELCCRDTCRELMDSLRSQWNIAKRRYPSLNLLPPPPNEGRPGSSADEGRLFPESAIWKICHDVCAGLWHIHAHGLVHFDIKPNNVFFVPHGRLGALCKIGDFGMAGEIGSSEDGQEGDQNYMAPELLSSDQKHPSADMFSLGITLYELASSLSFIIPSEGPRWHELRSGRHYPDIPSCRSANLTRLIGTMLRPSRYERPSADAVLAAENVSRAGSSCDQFLRDYLADIESFDRREELQQGSELHEDQTPRHAHTAHRVCSSPSVATFLPHPPLIYSPEAASS